MLKTPNLATFYRFEGDANDNSGNGINGTVNGASLTSTNFGRGYLFDGTNDYIDYGSTLIPTGRNDFSISVWVYVPSTVSATADLTIFSTSEEDGGTGTKLLTFYASTDFSPANGEVRVWHGAHMLLGPDIRDDTWHHLCLVRDITVTTLYLYVDGVFYSSATDNNIIYSSKAVRIGTDAEGGTFFMDGKIDEFTSYNSVLSSSDIKRVMMGMHPLNG